MENQVCLHCYQQITNPFCNKCCSEQLALWLNEFPIHPKLIIKIIAKTRNDSFPINTTDILCTKCGTELVSVCAYCFILNVENILEELEFPREIRKNLLEIFNHKLYNKGLSQRKDYQYN